MSEFEPIIVEVMDNEPCPFHKPKNRELAYVEWQEWAEEMDAKGERQVKCKLCGYWLFKCEV